MVTGGGGGTGGHGFRARRAGGGRGGGRGGGARSGYISSPPQARVPYLRRDQDYLLLGAVDWNKVLPVLTRETSVPSMLGDSNRPRREGAVPLNHLPLINRAKPRPS